LFGAAQDTTSRLIAMAVRGLGEDHSLQAELRANPAGIGDFIEEVLRYDAPVKAVYRLAIRDTSIGGYAIPAGTLVTVCLSAANNDASHFPDPATFDVARSGLRDHLAFSRGAHGCLGAPLGRMEAKIAIKRLLARTADIRLSVEHHGPPAARSFRFEPTYSFRNLADLHAEFVPAC
jgi:cytochrome P450